MIVRIVSLYFVVDKVQNKPTRLFCSLIMKIVGILLPPLYKKTKKNALEYYKSDFKLAKVLLALLFFAFAHESDLVLLTPTTTSLQL